MKRLLLLFIVILVAGCGAEHDKTMAYLNSSSAGSAGSTDSANQDGASSESSSTKTSNDATTSTTSALDEGIGISCTLQGTPMTYKFKEGNIRTEVSAVPGVTTYDLQTRDGSYTKITIAQGRCSGLRSAPAQTYDELWGSIVENAAEIASKMNPPYPRGSPVCTEEALSDSLFVIPPDCQIVG